MSNAPATAVSSHLIYPAKYWTASHTYDQWCKLSASDIVYKLRDEPGFEGTVVNPYVLSSSFADSVQVKMSCSISIIPSALFTLSE